MKVWKECSIEEVRVSETAFGDLNPENPDSEKTAVFNANGKLIGWAQLSGEGEKEHS